MKKKLSLVWNVCLKILSVDWQIHYWKLDRNQESQRKLVPSLKCLFVSTQPQSEAQKSCVSVNKNVLGVMTNTLLKARQKPGKWKKYSQIFLFTLMYDLSAPPTLRFFRFAQKTPLARNKNVVYLGTVIFLDSFFLCACFRQSHKRYVCPNRDYYF